MLLHLDDDADGLGHVETFTRNAQRLIDRRHGGFFKLNVHRRAGDLNYFPNVLCHRSLQSGCAADDFDNFFSNRCLTDAIHSQGQRIDHV